MMASMDGSQSRPSNCLSTGTANSLFALPAMPCANRRPTIELMQKAINQQQYPSRYQHEQRK
jgi:hypothetical protein